MLKCDFQKLSFDDISLILKSYYLDMSTKYSVDSGKMLFFFFLVFTLTISSESLFVLWLKKLFLVKIFPGFKKANRISMARAATENDKDVSTKIVAATFENNFGSAKVTGEKVRKIFGYFDTRKSEYLMEKVNFPENTLFISINHI